MTAAPALARRRPCTVSRSSLLLLLALASRAAAVALDDAAVPEGTDDTVSLTIRCTKIEEGEIDCNGTRHFSREHLKEEPKVCEQVDMEPVGTRNWWTYLAAALCCVCTAAMAAGLTLGLTSIDEFGLQVLCNRLVDEVEPEADPMVRQEAQVKLIKDQQCARSIIPVISGHYFYGSRKRGGCMPAALNPSNEHYLLVTLLLLNAAANEALPLFLDRLVPSWLAIILSVSVVLIFGEIIPSAIFTGKNQLFLAALFSPVVRLVKALLIPLAWPLSLCLDKVLGHEVDEHRREDLKALVRTMKRECLEVEEMNMIQGVLELHHKTTEVVAAPLEQAKMLAHDEVITEAVINDVLHWGHSRLFVYRRDPHAPSNRDDIMGVILVKKLLGINLDDRPVAGGLLHALKQPVVLSKEENLLNTFEMFREKCCHLAIIGDKPEVMSRALREQRAIPLDARPELFCSLEDVLEEMLKEEIYDEEDEEHQLRERAIPMGSRTSATSQSSKGSRNMAGSLLQTFAGRHVGTANPKAAIGRTGGRREAEIDTTTSSSSEDEDNDEEA